MRTLAISNQKGGVGKTTTAVNLAAAFGESKHRVLVIDLDPQANASAWLGAPEGGRGLFDALVDNVNLLDLVRPSCCPGVEIIPSSAWLASAEKTLASEVGAETLFAKALRQLPKDRWEVVLIDCPPALGLLSISALVAVKEVLIPVEAHVLPLAGLAALTQTLERVKDRLNGELTLSAILPCRVDTRTNLSKEVVARLRTKFGATVLDSMIRENVRLAEAPSFAKPITLYDPKGPGAEDYRAVAKELMRRQKKAVKP
jgi:chromosome partitioning protein